MNSLKQVGVVIGIIVAVSVFGQRLLMADKPGTVQHFRSVAVEVNNTKFWIPSTFIVKKGDTVEFDLVSNIPGANNVHGFAIDDFKVEALVTGKGEKVKFVADKAGIHPIRCHLHPAHVGGQLVVLE